MWRRPAADSNRRLLPSGREEEDAEPRCDRPLYRPLISPRLSDKGCGVSCRPPPDRRHMVSILCCSTVTGSVDLDYFVGLLDRDDAGCVTSKDINTEAMYLGLLGRANVPGLALKD